MVVTGYKWESWLCHRPKEAQDQRTQAYFSQWIVPITVDLTVIFQECDSGVIGERICALLFRLAQVQAVLQPKFWRFCSRNQCRLCSGWFRHGLGVAQV
jgi:hypothetical protein